MQVFNRTPNYRKSGLTFFFYADFTRLQLPHAVGGLPYARQIFQPAQTISHVLNSLARGASSPKVILLPWENTIESPDIDPAQTIAKSSLLLVRVGPANLGSALLYPEVGFIQRTLPAAVHTDYEVHKFSSFKLSFCCLIDSAMCTLAEASFLESKVVCEGGLARSGIHTMMDRFHGIVVWWVSPLKVRALSGTGVRGSSFEPRHGLGSVKVALTVVLGDSEDKIPLFYRLC